MVVATLCVLLGALRFLFPIEWEHQLSASTWAWVTAFALVTLGNCFFEYFFHRYILHRPSFRILAYFYRQHTKHHGLTCIRRRRTPSGKYIACVENRFPITEPEQDEASFFPWYTLGVFALSISPFLAGLQWIFPAFPWFLAGYSALASSLTLYEVFHFVEHWPIEKWTPLFDHPRWGRAARLIYGFHLRHHAVIDSNESVSGFFGLPVADWVFGTCVIPATLYTKDAYAPTDFERPIPYAFIRRIDLWVESRIRRHRLRSRSKPEVGKTDADFPFNVLSFSGLRRALFALLRRR